MAEQDLNQDPYVRYLSARKHVPVYLHPYLGNPGDELIWMGSELLLEALGMRRVFDSEKAQMILLPGGNQTMWSSNLRVWQECWKRWPSAQFVIAPATFQGDQYPWRAMLENPGGKVAALFARDPVSFANLQALRLHPAVELGLAHDPALHLRSSPWLRALRSRCAAEHILIAFRRDHEAAGSVLDSRSWADFWPFSKLWVRYYRHFHRGPNRRHTKMIRRNNANRLPIIEKDLAACGFAYFVDSILRASEIHTDRLHVMVLASLLSKEVHAYPTAYSKLEQIYAHSLASWAPVHFPFGGEGAQCHCLSV